MRLSKDRAGVQPPTLPELKTTCHSQKQKGPAVVCVSSTFLSTSVIGSFSYLIRDRVWNVAVHYSINANCYQSQQDQLVDCDLLAADRKLAPSLVRHSLLRARTTILQSTTRQFWENFYAPTCYLFNGIRFHFHLGVAGIPSRAATANGVAAWRKMKAAAQDRAGWRQVICGLWFTGSDKVKSTVLWKYDFLCLICICIHCY